VLDMFWAYYFATGDERAVRRVVAALDFLTDLGAAERYAGSAKTEDDLARAFKDALFRAASWSLLSLMEQHPPLQALCEHLLAGEDLTPAERCGLAMTLERANPKRWRVEIDPKTSTATIHRRG